MTWEAVEAEVCGAKAIAFDGCHKIYLAMDNEQTDLFREYGYGDDPTFLIAVGPVDQAMETLREWFDQSCGLRFISSVRTVEGDPNKGFTQLIAQGEEA